MPDNSPRISKRLQWWLEDLAHRALDGIVARLSGPRAFRLGEALGGFAWHLLPKRRHVVMRNLRIAFSGEKTLPDLHELAKQSFRRTAANLISASHTAKLTPAQLADVIEIENIGLLEDALQSGKGVVLLLSHMGNWEILSRIVHFFPKGTPAGAFYRPLNNNRLNDAVLARRQADGTRMFSKTDPFHSVTGFLRQNGVVGILADQRVGWQGERQRFFGRLTRSSPLPSLLARRAKAEVLALSVTTVGPGKWKASFLPVARPYTTLNCMLALELAMKASPVDVFWFQSRWKPYISSTWPITRWLEADAPPGEGKPHRALLWLPGTPQGWNIPQDWTHPDVTYEVIPADATLPGTDLHSLQRFLAQTDLARPLPIDFILTCRASKALVKAAKREGIPLISLAQQP